MVTLAVIPVRGGSKSIPGKNIRLLAGRPLLHWTLGAAVECPEVDQVIVSSDSQQILDVAISYSSEKILPMRRPPELATDEASTESALLHAVRGVDYDRVVLLQATSPLTTSEQISEALSELERHGYDSVLSVTREHRFRWERQESGVTPENYHPTQRPRRQDWSGELVENGALYITRRAALAASGCRLSGRVGAYVMPGRTAFELDTEEDWFVMERMLQSEGKALRVSSDIQLLISDVDGVLTDAGMYYGAEGEVLKKFSTRDGMGIRLWREAGRQFAIVTGENAPSVSRRAEKLGVTDVFLGVGDKLSLVEDLLAEKRLRWDQVAYVGDDLNDLEVLKRVGLSACPDDAHPDVRAACHRRLSRSGGAGCVRELIDLLLATPIGSKAR